MGVFQPLVVSEALIGDMLELTHHRSCPPWCHGHRGHPTDPKPAEIFFQGDEIVTQDQPGDSLFMSRWLHLGPCHLGVGWLVDSEFC